MLKKEPVSASLIKVAPWKRKRKREQKGINESLKKFYWQENKGLEQD